MVHLYQPRWLFNKKKVLSVFMFGKCTVDTTLVILHPQKATNSKTQMLYKHLEPQQDLLITTVCSFINQSSDHMVMTFVPK